MGAQVLESCELQIMEKDSRAPAENQNALDMESNGGDTISETESISEEERVRRLFAVCDADGDGFIDR